VNFLGQVEELELAASVADGGEAADELSDAGAVEVVDIGHVEDDFFLTLGDQVADGGAKVADFGAKDEPSVNVENGDVGDFAGIDLNRQKGSGAMVEGGKVIVKEAASES